MCKGDVRTDGIEGLAGQDSRIQPPRNFLLQDLVRRCRKSPPTRLSTLSACCVRFTPQLFVWLLIDFSCFWRLANFKLKKCRASFELFERSFFYWSQMRLTTCAEP
mmetsp:Transcript_8977/g.19293  ORF Transcript_8977/g.19293 Transcript_8977/m.19293 type:complete len:106 (+) Transcript_8977:526-843(+)